MEEVIRMRRFWKIALLLSLLYLMNISQTAAFHVKTHEKINEYIVESSLDGFSMDSYLVIYLGFPKGKEETFKSQKGECKLEETYKVKDWIKHGGTWEDNPPPDLWSWPPRPGGIFCPDIIRAFNHFYNPLTDQGYSSVPPLTGNATLEWFVEKDLQEEPGNLIWNNLGRYSWKDIKDYFFKGLTSTDEAERADAFADTFRGLGQLMHLVEDMSVPLHTTHNEREVNL